MASKLNLTVHLKCGICNEIYKDPQQLSCLHSFCKGCIDQLEKNIYGQVSCIRCGQLRGTSQNKQDSLLSSLKDLNIGEPNKHKTCNVDHDMPENIQDHFLAKSSKISQNAKDYNAIIRDEQDKMIQEQQNLHREKAENLTKISKYFGNLKTTFMEHLARQEQMLQDETNKYYLQRQDLIDRKVKQCRSITERLELDVELLHLLQQVQPSVSHLQVVELMETDLKTCKAKIPSDDNKTMAVCQDESKVNALLDLIPCYLKFSDEQNESTIETSADETGPKYNYTQTNDTTVNDQEQTKSGYPPEVHQNNALQHVDSGGTQIATFPVNRIKRAPTIERTETLDGEAPPAYFEYGDHVTGFKSILAGDEKAKAPVGLAWIDGNRILMVDRFNRKLKLVNEDGSPISITELQNAEPWDVVYTSRKTIKTAPGRFEEMDYCAVSVPTVKTILYVQVTDNIEIIKRIKTSFNYCSLGHDKSGHTLVCGICPPFDRPAVHIISSEGIVLREFALDSLGKPLFEYPRSIDVTPDGEIIVCDWKRGCLVFLKTDGYILGEYKGSKEHVLKEPIGTALDGLGNILVADSATHSIQTISVRDQEFVSYVKLNIKIDHPREITMTSPGHYPKLAAVAFNSVVIFDLWCSSPDSVTSV